MSSITIMVIEDNDAIRENVVEILELAGYVVYSANNGKDGVDSVLQHIPDIILCDIMMPELDGYGVLYLLNKNPKTNHIPFIFLTAKAEHLDVRKGMEMGADDYLTKPFGHMELLNAVESRLRKKGQQHQFYSKALDQLNGLISKIDGLSELNRVIKERKIRLFKKNQVLYHEGDKGSGLYLVISGRIKSIRQAEDGRELMTGIYTVDDYVGVNSALSGQPYTDTVTAIEDSTLCQIPQAELDSLLNQYPEVALKFIKVLAKDMRDKEELLIQLTYNSVRKKMAEAMIRLYRSGNNSGTFNIAREDLAAMAGMALETVSRTLADFKAEGLIEKKGSVLTILDLGRLSKMKN
jgi:CRP-like cAMP-binding protein/CheY-like chemotaxis protein